MFVFVNINGREEPKCKKFIIQINRNQITSNRSSIKTPMHPTVIIIWLLHKPNTRALRPTHTEPRKHIRKKKRRAFNFIIWKLNIRLFVLFLYFILMDKYINCWVLKKTHQPNHEHSQTLWSKAIFLGSFSKRFALTYNLITMIIVLVCISMYSFWFHRYNLLQYENLRVS